MDLIQNTMITAAYVAAVSFLGYVVFAEASDTHCTANIPECFDTIEEYEEFNKDLFDHPWLGTVVMEGDLDIVPDPHECGTGRKTIRITYMVGCPQPPPSLHRVGRGNTYERGSHTMTLQACWGGHNETWSDWPECEGATRIFPDITEVVGPKSQHEWTIDHDVLED